LKKVEVVGAEEVEVRSFDPALFTPFRSGKYGMETVTKKKIREIAEQLELSYNEAQVSFAKKVVNAYIKKEI
jgi:hypothetical protein